jgi:hypothetical protein
MMAKAMAESKVAPPGIMLAGWPPALVMTLSSLPFSRAGPMPRKPFFRLQDNVHARGKVVRDKRGNADAEVCVVAVGKFQAYAGCDNSFSVHIFSP